MSDDKAKRGAIVTPSVFAGLLAVEYIRASSTVAYVIGHDSNVDSQVCYVVVDMLTGYDHAVALLEHGLSLTASIDPDHTWMFGMVAYNAMISVRALEAYGYALDPLTVSHSTYAAIVALANERGV